MPSGHGLINGSALSASSVWAVGGKQAGGHLSAAPLPGGGGTRLLVQAIAHVPGTGISYGAGFTHKKNNAGEGLRAVVLVTGRRAAERELSYQERVREPR